MVRQVHNIHDRKKWRDTNEYPKHILQHGVSTTWHMSIWTPSNDNPSAFLESSGTLPTYLDHYSVMSVSYPTYWIQYKI